MRVYEDFTQLSIETHRNTAWSLRADSRNLFPPNARCQSNSIDTYIDNINVSSVSLLAKDTKNW